MKRQLLSEHLSRHSTLVRHTTRFSLGKGQTAAEQALCFIETFGLSVEKVVLKSKDDSVVELNYSSPSSLADTATDPEQDTSVDETYLLEKFGVSDECYHELTMIRPNLPRSYKVRNIRSNVSSAVDIQKLPALQEYYGRIGHSKTILHPYCSTK